MSRFDPSIVDIEDFLDVLEVRNLQKATAEEMKFSCPLPSHPGSDQDPSCYMNINTTAYFCHGCHSKGNAIHFTSEMLGITPLEAIRMLKQRYQPGGINIDAVSVADEVKKILDAEKVQFEQPLLEEEIVEQFAVDWGQAHLAWMKHGTGHPACDYMFERGFEPEWLEKWEFGYDHLSDRVVFAVRDEKSRLIGFKGRSYDGRNPKYLLLGDKEGRADRYGWNIYTPTRIVYGGHRLTGHEQVVICEGELNAVSCWEKTGRPAVALQGSHPTEYQARIIRERADSAVIFLDSDLAGNTAIWGTTNSRGEFTPGIAHMLAPFMPVHIVSPHKGDPAVMDASEIDYLVEEAQSILRIVAKV